VSAEPIGDLVVRWLPMSLQCHHSKSSMDGESRPWLCSCPSSRMSVRSELIMRLDGLREIILRGRMVLASVSLGQADLA
jgi:hypothetical protein